ncbi:hypothetical protein L596_028886 [Steinernema carpocapsae]|uniref:OTU domain-containing protein n=1 Tax=Steinernema carpocapsae TaxID=34508 RepID=A0A4U5LZN5_STECR|nr:hypothetical protein L596_028886 [Steinernema carpocapsae]
MSYRKRVRLSIDAHAERMEKNRTFMTDFELQMAALALNTTIYVYSPNLTTKWLQYSPKRAQSNRLRQTPPYPDRPTCLMQLQNVHFDPIYGVHDEEMTYFDVKRLSARLARTRTKTDYHKRIRRATDR